MHVVGEAVLCGRFREGSRNGTQMDADEGRCLTAGGQKARAVETGRWRKRRGQRKVQSAKWGDQVGQAAGGRRQAAIGTGQCKMQNAKCKMQNGGPEGAVGSGQWAVSGRQSAVGNEGGGRIARGAVIQQAGGGGSLPRPPDRPVGAGSRCGAVSRGRGASGPGRRPARGGGGPGCSAPAVRCAW